MELQCRIPRNIIDSLGEHIGTKEKTNIERIEDDSWYTARLDGSRFSKIIRKLKKNKVIEEGYSLIFERVMKSTLRDLLEMNNEAILGFVQSDEMTILFRPKNSGEKIKE